MHGSMGVGGVGGWELGDGWLVDWLVMVGWGWWVVDWLDGVRVA